MLRRFATGLAGLFALGVSSVFFAGGAHAGLLTYDPTGVISAKLFTTEVKFDKNVNNSSQRGHDVFLRNGEAFAGPSSNFAWPASGTIFDWSLSYNGNTASFVFGGLPALQLNVNPDGLWNAFRIDLKSSDENRFDSASVAVSVTSVNGGALGAPVDLSASLSSNVVEDYQFMNFQNLSSLTGTMRFDYVVKSGATGSPNSRLRFNIKALSLLNPPTEADLPEPATLGLFAVGLAGLAAAASRRRRRTE